MLEDLVIAVPGGGADAVARLAARLEALGLVGWVIDGATLGHGGWAIARVAADEDGALVTDRDGDLQLLELEDLHDALAEEWPQVQVGDVVIDDVEVVGPLCQSPETPLHEVAYASAKGMWLDLEASMEKLTLAEVRLGTKLLFARVQPIVGPEHELIDVFSTARGGSVVLWRRGHHLVLQVLRRSVEVELHVWEPPWTPLRAEGHDELRDELRPMRGDASEIAKILRLPSDSVIPLRALLEEEDPPLAQLCDLLGLPDEAWRVISGECGVEDLPGAVIHEPKTFIAAVRAAMRPSDDDPAWVRRFHADSRELRPWYVVSSLLTIALGFVLMSRKSRGSRLIGFALALGSGIELPTRWWLKRRRSPS